MTLNITSSQIQIKNSANEIKFTSDNKLVYTKAYQSGQIAISSQTAYIPFTRLTNANDFLVINLFISSCTGDTRATGALLNNLIPANSGIVIDFYGREESGTAAADTEILGVALIDNYLVFKSNRFYYNNVVSNGIRSTNLTYYAYILSYL